MTANTRKIAMNGICIALFVVFSLCLQVPVFENYYLCLGYIVMMVCCYSFGAVSGSLVGVLGVILYCLLISGLRGMPGWAAGNLLIGIVLGLSLPHLKNIKNAALRYLTVTILVIAVNAAAMLLIKSGVEALLYSQPMLLRIGKNVYAFAADAFMLAVSFPIAELVEKRTRVRAWYET